MPSRRATQLNLSPVFAPRARHGGDIHKGRRKLARPIDPKRPLHITFRSAKAREAYSLLHPKNAARIRDKTAALARRFEVRVYQFANSGNHLHLLIRGKTRKGIQDFLRALGCRVAQIVTDAKKGQPFGKFWDGLAFSRVVEWGRDFIQTRYCILKNELEAEGFLQHDRTPRARRKRGQPPPSQPLDFRPEWKTSW